MTDLPIDAAEFDALADSLRTLSDEIGAGARGADAAERAMRRFTRNIGDSVVDAFEDLAVKGRSAGDVLRDVGLSLSRTVLNAALSPVGDALGQSVASLALRVAPSIFTGASGGVAAPVQQFARGGVVSSPTFFSMGGRRVGVAGEAGPEAILPLARGPDGRLGVSTRAGDRPQAIAVTINTTDADSFRRSRAQVTAQIARAFDRGRRNL